MPRIIEIGQSFTELLKNKSGMFYGPRCRGKQCFCIVQLPAAITKNI